MTSQSSSTDRLPTPGAGFVWAGLGDVLVLRPEDTELLAAFTTRRGGASPPPWRSMNLSLVVGDEPQRVLDNRRRLSAICLGGRRWAAMRQVHGAEVIEASLEEGLEGDAVWTEDPLRPVAVLAADCLPVLLAGPHGIAAAHAGWRGAITGVVQAAAIAVDAREAWVGPGIGPCCYGVGREVIEAFADRYGDDVLNAPDRVDLAAAVRLALREAGVTSIHVCALCTSCHDDLFFSHRRDGGVTGRQALVAALP